MFHEWVKVESVYAQVYLIKCKRLRNRNDSLRGTKQKKLKKGLFGGIMLIVLLAILWFPLFLFAFSGALGQSNVPTAVQVTLQIGRYEALFKAEASRGNIIQFNQLNWNKLVAKYSKNPNGALFLEDFEATDVVAVPLGVRRQMLTNLLKTLRVEL